LRQSRYVTHKSAIRENLIISDAWYPQINGVVRTLQSTVEDWIASAMKSASWEQIPALVELSVAFLSRNQIGILRLSPPGASLSDFHPDLIHIATEGPLGWAARRLCLRLNLPFTTPTIRVSRVFGGPNAQLFCEFRPDSGFCRAAAFPCAIQRRDGATASIERNSRRKGSNVWFAGRVRGCDSVPSL